MKNKRFDFSVVSNTNDDDNYETEYNIDSLESDIVYTCILFIQKIKNQQNSFGSDLFNKIESIDLQNFIYNCFD